jgi:hypothetical protein
MSVSSAFTSTLRATSSVFVPRAAGVRLPLNLIFYFPSSTHPRLCFNECLKLAPALLSFPIAQSKGSDMLLSQTPNGSIYGTTPGGMCFCASLL